MTDPMRYNLTFGHKHHLMYTGVMVTPALQEYAERLVFEEGSLNTGLNGDSLHRDRDNYHVAIFYGRGSYIVVLSYNPGLRNAARRNDHDGYLMLDVKMVGHNLSDALLVASGMLRALTVATDFTPIDAEDRARFQKAKVKWEKDRLRRVA